MDEPLEFKTRKKMQVYSEFCFPSAFVSHWGLNFSEVFF